MKEIEIKIVRNEEERRKEIRAMSDCIMSGHIEDKHTIVITAELFAKIFSPKRLDLLMLLTKKENYNVSELARKLKRPFEVVYRDLKIFQNFDMVKLVKEHNEVIPELKGRIKMPVIA